MNFGFNTNVRVGSVVYHVQSEDRGPAHPFLDTSVYDGGRVVYRRSTNYTDLAGLATDTEARQQILHERLTQQHRDVIAQLQAGTLPLGPQAGTQAQPVQKSDPPDSPGLEVRLLNPRSWLSAGNATLEVEVRTSGGASVVPGAKVEASIEASNGDSVAFRTHADPLGRATLSFPTPSILGDGAALTIRATSGALSKELSFRLRVRPAEATPAPSLK